jgi:hypothetical protein
MLLARVPLSLDSLNCPELAREFDQDLAFWSEGFGLVGTSLEHVQFIVRSSEFRKSWAYQEPLLQLYLDLTRCQDPTVILPCL